MIAEEIGLRSFTIVKETIIAASPEIVFKTLLESHGPLKEMNLKLEARPGGRWYRDIGGDNGHLWGHVQVIKPGKVLELVGPTMMSFPVNSFIQYKLTETAGSTMLKFTHQAFGMIPPDFETGLHKGWGETMDAIKAAAESD